MPLLCDVDTECVISIWHAGGREGGREGGRGGEGRGGEGRAGEGIVHTFAGDRLVYINTLTYVIT